MKNAILFLLSFLCCAVYGQVDKITGDTIKLKGFWKISKKRYYEVGVIKLDKKRHLDYSYRFDNYYNFIDFEGCSDEIELLSEENNRIKRKDN
ncbi:MAG: hypothetical protein WCR52_13555 [Bacteroidota bacterium]|uniref:hypothetical protein n=1 Tax=Runella sp. TaxID=1960881 RepID=UPI00301B2A9E